MLVLCQLISATGSIVIVTLGGLIGTTLSPDPALATLPVSIMVISVAAVAIPAAMLMKRIGRKAGFALASLSAIVSMLLAAWALEQQSFVWFVVAAGLLGINMAFTQQYRYAAAESVDTRFVGRAISMVLLGAIGGAFLGPDLVTRGQFWVEGVPNAGTLLAVSALYVIQFILLLFLGRFDAEHESAAKESPRPLGQIVRQPVFIVAVISGTAAYAVMSFIMTATPIAMHVSDGFTLAETAFVIQSHVLGMYVPSLFSGFLLDRMGTVRVMAIGAIALLISCLIAWYDHTYIHYWGALVALGIGWNFLYVGATTMLTFTYQGSERFKAQGINEFSVFGSAGAGSLLAGTIVHLYGWTPLVLLPVPVLLIVLMGLYLVRNNQLLSRFHVSGPARNSE